MPYRRIRKRSRNPISIAVVSWLFTYGLACIIFETFPGAIINSSTEAFRWYWAALIVGGSFASLIGFIIKKAEDGLLWESVGMVFLGLGLMIYGAFILADGNAGSFFAGGFFFLVGTGTWFESYLIRHDVRELGEQFRKLRKGPEL